MVELLIVFAIISVLLSLISAAVWKAIVVANRTRNRSEISQLAASVENFKSQRYQFYPPSRLHLAETLNAYNLAVGPNGQPVNPLDADSVQALLRMFPNLMSPGGAWSSGGSINWGGRKASDPPVNTVLEGDQCLVFFLGGIPDNFSGATNCTGFSTNPADPSYHIKNGGDTLPPFFEFDSSRLVRLVPKGSHRDGRFYAYLDTYRQAPYAYFSSGKSRDDFNRYYPQLHSSDCPSLAVWPYAQNISAGLGAATVKRPVYFNSSSFQIISAGADGLFGPGTVIQGVDGQGVWRGGPPFPPNTAVYKSTDPGFDDQSNFAESVVGLGS
jgi:hypothetical protein